MDNSFDKNYAREQEIRRQFDVSEAQGSEEGMASARDAYQDFKDSIMAREAFTPVLVDAFRRHGIKRSTYSSSWSGAAGAVWEFIQHGWALEGMLEINSQHMGSCSDKYVKVHGYVFSI